MLEIHKAIQLLWKFKVINMYVLGEIIFSTRVVVVVIVFHWTYDGLFC